MEEGRKQISIREVINHISNGVTRRKGDPGYIEELGSIQEKYNLNKADVTLMFKHPLLKGLRVRAKKESSFTLIDDVNQEEAAAMNSASYGERSLSNVSEEPQGTMSESPVETWGVEVES